VTKHGFEDGSSINEPELSSQSDAIDLELQAGLPPTVESRWGIEPVLSKKGGRRASRRSALELIEIRKRLSIAGTRL
jgi:hypothetical protein